MSKHSNSSVQRDGRIRHILLDDIYYRDTLHSRKQMKEQALVIYNLHNHAALTEPHPKLREYQFRLRNNAMARVEQWS
jgi:hypothetical protein